MTWPQEPHFSSGCWTLHPPIKKKINKKILNLSNYYPVLETSSVDFKGPFENASYKCKNEMYPEELQRLRKILEPH